MYEQDGFVLISTIKKLKYEFKAKKSGFFTEFEKWISGGFLSNLMKFIENICCKIYSFFYNMDEGKLIFNNDVCNIIY